MLFFFPGFSLFEWIIYTIGNNDLIMYKMYKCIKYIHWQISTDLVILIHFEEYSKNRIQWGETQTFRLKLLLTYLLCHLFALNINLVSIASSENGDNNCTCVSYMEVMLVKSLSVNNQVSNLPDLADYQNVKWNYWS